MRRKNNTRRGSVIVTEQFEETGKYIMRDIMMEKKRLNKLQRKKKIIRTFIKNSIWFTFGFGSAMMVMAICIKDWNWLISAASVASIAAMEATIIKGDEN